MMWLLFFLVPGGPVVFLACFLVVLLGGLFLAGKTTIDGSTISSPTAGCAVVTEGLTCIVIIKTNNIRMAFILS